MTRVVELPLWLFVLVLLFAAVTFASHFLFPSVRWFLRRRAQRLVDRLNERLEWPIEPFKLARRTDTIQRLIYDPEVIDAVQEHARSNGVREDVAFELARRYAREIVPGFSATAYFSIAIRAARWLSNALYRVHLARPAHDIDPEATVVFVINHRSNMDYVLVTYLVAETSALAYAVGEWARIWPLGPLIRALGGYFIRRRSRNALYRRVLARYVQIATGAGVTQAMFPEGGLSQDGRLGAPKLGLLSYITGAFDPAGRDVVFVPVGLNYDRVIEDSLLIEARRKGEKRFRGTIPSATLFGLRYIWRRIRGRARRFGHAAVSFGEPLSLRAFGADPDPQVLADALMARIGRAVPLLPVPLVAAALARQDEAVTRDALLADLAAHLDVLRAEGGVVAPPNSEPEEILDKGLAHLALRRIVVEEDGMIRVMPAKADHIAYYAASLAGWETRQQSLETGRTSPKTETMPPAASQRDT